MGLRSSCKVYHCSKVQARGNCVCWKVRFSDRLLMAFTIKGKNVSYSSELWRKTDLRFFLLVRMSRLVISSFTIDPPGKKIKKISPHQMHKKKWISKKNHVTLRNSLWYIYFNKQEQRNCVIHWYLTLQKYLMAPLSSSFRSFISH